MGGPIALEMARMLSCDSAEVERLAIISSDLDDPVPAAYGHDGAALVLDAFAVGTDLTLADLQGLPIDKQLDLAVERAARVAPTGRHIFTVREARQLFDMGQRHARALLDYRPASYAGDVVLLRPMSERNGATPAMGWAKVAAGRLIIEDVSGDHNSILTEEVDVLAGVLARHLGQPPIARAESAHLAVRAERDIEKFAEYGGTRERGDE